MNVTIRTPLCRVPKELDDYASGIQGTDPAKLGCGLLCNNHGQLGATCRHLACKQGERTNWKLRYVNTIPYARQART